MAACDTCARKGVLIYPVRYAIACPAGAADAPGLAGNFKIEGAPADIGKAKYTLRSMREGYLYAYDEKRGTLRAWVVTRTGQLWNFDVGHLPPAPASIKFNCQNQADATFSRCIDIAHQSGNVATNIWIGWTSVVWTKALIAKVGDPAWRAKHMQCINVPALVAETAAHTGQFANTSKQVAHFGMSEDALEKAFAFSNTSFKQDRFQSNLRTTIEMTMATHAPYNKGYIVALNDPVGITNDLSELTIPSVDAGFNEDIARGKMVYELLQTAEQGLRDEAKKGVSQAATVAAYYAANPERDVYTGVRTLWTVLKAGGQKKYEEKVAADKKKYGDHMVGQQRAAADHAWEEVTIDGTRKLLDETRISAFPKLYSDTLKAFEPEYQKLARIHHAWLTSPLLANWLDGVHDSTDIRSGYAYSESVMQCIGAGVNTDVCSQQLFTWLNSGKLSDHRNLYGRGLLFNQETLVKAAEPKLKNKDIKYEELLNVYKLSLERVGTGIASRLVDRLALGTANLFVKALNGTAYSSARALALIHMTCVGGTTIKAVPMKPTELGKWIVAQAKLQRVEFTGTKQEIKVAAYQEAKAFLKANPAGRGILAYELDVGKLEADGRVTPGSMSGIRIPGFAEARRWLGTSKDFGIGVVTTIIQLAALTYVADDFVMSDPNMDVDTRTKMGFACVGLTAGLVETVMTTVAKAPSHPLAQKLTTQWSMSVAGAKKAAFLAKCVGLAAGVIAGAYDIYQGIQKWNDGDKVMGFLTVASGFVGAGVALAMFVGSAAFWPLLIVSIILGIVIAVLNRDELKEWIAKCYFSTGVTEIRKVNQEKGKTRSYPFTTTEDELMAYKEAVGA